ncbi:hypothetical protein [Streptomyces sp. SHP 1-2]|uniref:hypothetical protein n=1 Tax=Streptomyces sp. SHP 1-2 TaxID=2769489 RepID=UPI002237D057|nr:hypothetical protein [Streptomyces sp. SHP 1-2]MCW5253543.1 hypothetical protein [Streptomyces sp. SHP 1-2]
MRYIHRALYVGYGVLFGWLAWCAVMSARNGALGVCGVFVAGSGLVMAAVLREGMLEDALRREVLRERSAGRGVTDASDAVVAVALAGWCCDAWAATAGAEHARSCRHWRPKGNAA